MEEQKQFLANNKKRPGVIETPSGLQYEILKMGDGTKPNSVNSRVKVHYAGTLMDGKEFDSSYKRGEPAEFELKNVIKGWTEGLQLMPVGSKFKFYIPSDLGYGEHGQGPIPAYSTLIFEVELLDVTNPDQSVIKGEKYQFQQYQRQ
ncbi:MAG: FKBP-type peptidyl-prolyl cis-trans isomerase [Paludibacteraceae bacterium]|nr:FKBP-type peptidyl-prolyl cis-trans isomerase [Paludibacteraceae bacterium]